MPDAHAARRQKLAVKVAESGADAALVTHLVNVRYLTGLASSNAALLVSAAGEGPAAAAAVLATDSRDALVAARDCAAVEPLTRRDVRRTPASWARPRGPRPGAFRAHPVSLGPA